MSLNNIMVDDHWESLLGAFVNASPAAYRSALAFSRASSDNPLLPREDIAKLHQFIFEQLKIKLAAQDRAKDRDNISVLDRCVKDVKQDESTDVCTEGMVPAIMVFEYMKNMRLRPEQVRDVALMITANDKVEGNSSISATFAPLILQRLMAYGKSSVLGTLLALRKADGHHLSVLVPPASLFEINSQDMSEQSFSLFGQRAHVIAFNREPHYLEHNVLSNIHHTMLHAIREREYLIVSPTTIQMMINVFVELVIDASRILAAEDKVEAQAVLGKLRLLAPILKLLRDRGAATFDVCIGRIIIALMPLSVIHYVCFSYE